MRLLLRRLTPISLRGQPGLMVEGQQRFLAGAQSRQSCVPRGIVFGGKLASAALGFRSHCGERAEPMAPRAGRRVSDRRFLAFGFRQMDAGA